MGFKVARTIGFLLKLFMPRRKNGKASLDRRSDLTSFSRAPASQLLWVVGICSVISVAALVCFWPLHRSDFVNFDDPDYVTENRQAQSGIHWTTVQWAFGTRRAGNWHPVTWLSHSLDCQLFGLDPGAHHLVNLGFHAANAMLVFLLFRKMTGALWRPALLAALFALHPLHVEAVAWISERKEVLSSFFFMLTVLAYARYAQGRGAPREPPISPSAEGSRTGLPQPRLLASFAPWYLGALLLFALGLLSKPMLVTTPFVLLLLDYWPLQRIGHDPTFRKETLTRLFAEKIPFLVLSIASCVVTFQVQQQAGAVKADLSLWERVQNAIVSYAEYIGRLFWPLKLSVIYPHPGKWPAGVVLVSFLLLVLVTVFVFTTGRKRKYLVVGWLWFLGTLVPVIGLVQVGHQSTADRYTYLPLTGLFLMLVWGVRHCVFAVADKEATFSYPAAAAACLVLGVCAALTHRQVTYWQDGETLFRQALKATRNNFMAHNHLAMYFSDHGDTTAALEQYRISAMINPAFGETQNNLGVELARKGDLGEALTCFSNAVSIDPRQAAAHNNLGMALSARGQPLEAVAEYEKCLLIEPDNARAHGNLARTLTGLGRLDEAIGHYRQASKLNPADVEAHLNLANVLAQQGNLEEALRECNEVLRLKPDHELARQAVVILRNGMKEKGNP